MCEDALTALRVIDGPAGEIPADGHSYHSRRREVAIGAPAHQRQFVAELLHRGPDVVEELDLNHWLEPTSGHTHCAAHDIRFRQRRIEDTIAAVLGLQAGGEFENATFAFDLLLFQILFAADVGHVFAKDHDPLVAT